MSDWLDDTIDQIALGEYLATSSLSCGTRFCIIAVDNAIEFMLIYYLELHKQLVGGHKQGGISNNEWKEIKRHFESLLDKCIEHEPNLDSFRSDVVRFHQLRSSLYHTGMPTTVSKLRATRHVTLARNVLETLFGMSYSDNGWSTIQDRIKSTLGGAGPVGAVKQQVTFARVNDRLRFVTNSQVTQAEAVVLCLYGFGVEEGRSPSREELADMLRRSGYSVEANALRAKLSDLRKPGKNWIRKGSLDLTAKGRDALFAKYQLS